MRLPMPTASRSADGLTGPPVRKPTDKVIAPVLLDNPVLSHADITPKIPLLYQCYCIDKLRPFHSPAQNGGLLRNCFVVGNSFLESLENV